MMAIRRKVLKRGFEPDNCYYVQNEPRVFGKKKLNFAKDPPPDLAIEVELRSGASKIPIYESFRVPELWRVVNQQIHVLVLSAEGVYVPQSGSVCLPGFPFDKAAEVLQKMDTVGQTELVRSFRDWVRTSLS
jgi:Uma2 family endonuclease